MINWAKQTTVTNQIFFVLVNQGQQNLSLQIPSF
jgi:hypothetical protein